MTPLAPEMTLRCRLLLLAGFFLLPSEQEQTLLQQYVVGTLSTAASPPVRTPSGLVWAPDGVLILSDTNNHRLLVTKTPTLGGGGGVAILAGSGVAKWSDGTGTSASFSTPRHLALLPSGVVVVGDQFNHRIRLCTRGGVVTTLAGSGAAGHSDGVGSSALFSSPRGVTTFLDTVFVADVDNHCIRKVTLAGTVTTLAGTPKSFGFADGLGLAAKFWVPRAIAADPVSGDLYVADVSNCRIRRVTPEGNVSVYIGNSSTCSAVEGGADGVGTMATLRSAGAVAVDWRGNVFVTDTATRQLRMVTPDRAMRTIVSGTSGAANGFGTAAQFDVNGLTVDVNGTLYGSNYATHTFCIISPTCLKDRLPGWGSLATDPTSCVQCLASPNGTCICQAGQYSNDGFLPASLACTPCPPGQKSAPGSSVCFTPHAVFTPCTLNATCLGAPLRLLPDTTYWLASQGSANYAPSTNYFLTLAPPFGFTVKVRVVLMDTEAGFDYLIATGGQSGPFAGSDLPPDALLAAAPAPPPFFSSGSLPWNASTNPTLGGEFSSSLTLQLFSNAALVGRGVVLLAHLDAFVCPPSTPIYVLSAVRASDVSCGAACPIGAYLSAPAICSPCGLGTASSALNALSCPPCSPGSYAASLGQVTCTPCGGGTWASESGAVACSQCSPGTARGALGGTTPCPSCPANTYADSGARECLPCAKGTLSPPNSAVCLDCLASTCVPALHDAWVSTWAGGSAGMVEGVGAQAKFNAARGAVCDAQGNIYLADRSNSRVRVMDVRGEMRTLSGFGEATTAGSGTSVTFTREGSPGYGYVDGDGTLAQFRSPWYLTMGPDAGSLTLTDNSNRRIRRVLLGNGSVSTLAGSGEASTTDGAATEASFLNPKGLAFDGDGVLFIVDGTMLRRLSRGQVVSTLVGKGATASALRDPHGLAAHPLTGTLYVADYPAKQVKSVSPAGSVQVFAGSGMQSYTDGIGTTATFVNPYHVSLDPTLTALYVADNAIRRIELASAEVTTLAGTNAPGSRDGIAAAALFREPFSVAPSPFSGIVYVVDGGDTLRVLQGASIYSSVLAGSGLRKTVNGRGTGASFNAPACLALEEDGNLIVSDSGGAVLRSVTPEGLVTTLAGSGGNQALDGVGTLSGFGKPMGCKIAGTLLYVADAWGSAVRLVQLAVYPTSVSTLAGRLGVSGLLNGNSSAALFAGPTDVALDDAGRLFVCDQGNNVIRAVSADGAVVSTLAGDAVARFRDGPLLNASFKAPSSLAYRPGGFLYVTDTGNHRLRLVRTSGSGDVLSVSTLAGDGIARTVDASAGSSASFSSPTGLAVDSQYIYVAERSTLRRVTLLGAVSTLLGSRHSAGRAEGAGTSALLNSPSAVLAGSPGQIYLADTGNDVVLSIATGACPPGHYCNSALHRKACPAGRYGLLQGFTSSSCSGECPEKFFCPAGTVTPLPCLPGSYCPPASPAPTPCPPGSFSSSPQASTCQLCAPGYFSSTAGASTCSGLCPLGTFRSRYGGVSEAGCAPCAQGSYGESVGISSCSLCEAGYASNATRATSADTCRQCPPGSWASPGAAACSPCGPGLYSATRGATSPTTCLPCQAGRYSEAQGANSSATCLPCAAGTSSGGAGAAEAAACIPCGPGLYSATRGASSPTACLPCQPGRFSDAQGANSSATCRPCPAGTSSSATGATSLSFTGRPQCALCDAGTFSLEGNPTCTPCPLGTYSMATGGQSLGVCQACPPPSTTVTQGAVLVSQCITLPFACGPGLQRATTAAPLSSADCRALSCPPPLRFQGGNGSSSSGGGGSGGSGAPPTASYCVGCAPGKSGSSSACSPCTEPLTFCPGLTSHPLVNFSAFYAEASAPALSLSARGTRQRRALARTATASTLLDACPSLTTSLSNALQAVVATPRSLLSKSFLALAVGGAIVGLFLVLAAFVARLQPASLEWANSYLKSVDLFSLNHQLEPEEVPVKKSTSLGGIFSLLSLTIIISYSAYMVESWLENNTLVQVSLRTLEEETWSSVGALPFASNIALPFAGLAPPPPPSTVVLQVQVDGDAGACAAPLAWSQSGLQAGAWSLATAPAACGAAGSLASHVLTCAGCIFTSTSQLRLVFHYSCQAFLLSASSAQPYPTAKTSLFTAPPAQTRGSAAGLLQDLVWTVTPVLSVLWDNVTSESSVGWMLSGDDLEVGPLQALSAGEGGLLLQPASASVTLAIKLPLADTYQLTLLTPKVPWTALIANIVGLSGIVGLVGVLFSHYEKRLSVNRARGLNLRDLGSGKSAASAAGDAAGAGAGAATATTSNLSTRVPAAAPQMAVAAVAEAAAPAQHPMALQWKQANPLFSPPTAATVPRAAHSAHWAAHEDIPVTLSARRRMAERAGCPVEVVDSAVLALARDELPPNTEYHSQADDGSVVVVSLPDGSTIPDPRDHFEDYLALHAAYWRAGSASRGVE